MYCNGNEYSCFSLKTKHEWWVKGRLLDVAQLPPGSLLMPPRYLVSKSQKHSVTNRVAEEDRDP
jgi:hypothetical protein